MHVPELPADEVQRLAALRALGVLDTMPEERFDRITRLAQRLFQAPIALVSLVDAERQWFKSRSGLDATETGRDISFCGHAILAPELFVVPDASEDERFHDNPLVTGDPHIRFYAGQPLRAPNDTQIGTLCVIDRRPRGFSAADRDCLRDLAAIVEEELRTSALANTDALTELVNRRGFSAAATKRLAQPEPATLVYLDLDGFKAINDTFGHQTGDEALQIFARVLQEHTRLDDIPARLGGDEFCVLVSGGEVRARQLVGAVRAQLGTLPLPYEIRFSSGMLPFCPDTHDCIAAFMAAGDEKMYADKRQRKQALAS